jgi:hypothetical protein
VLLQQPKQYGGWSRSCRWQDCNCCCVGCIVMLQDHTSRQIICLGRWSNTLQAADWTGMRKWKWLFVTGCELQETDCYCEVNIRWVRCINILGDCAEILWYFIAFNQLYSTLWWFLFNSYDVKFTTKYSSCLVTSKINAIPRYTLSPIPLCLPLSCSSVLSIAWCHHPRFLLVTSLL